MLEQLQPHVTEMIRSQFGALPELHELSKKRGRYSILYYDTIHKQLGFVSESFKIEGYVNLPPTEFIDYAKMEGRGRSVIARRERFSSGEHGSGSIEYWDGNQHLEYHIGLNLKDPNPNHYAVYFKHAINPTKRENRTPAAFVRYDDGNPVEFRMPLWEWDELLLHQLHGNIFSINGPPLPSVVVSINESNGQYTIRYPHPDTRYLGHGKISNIRLNKPFSVKPLHPYSFLLYKDATGLSFSRTNAHTGMQWDIQAPTTKVNPQQLLMVNQDWIECSNQLPAMFNIRETPLPSPYGTALV